MENKPNIELNRFSIAQTEGQSSKACDYQYQSPSYSSRNFKLHLKLLLKKNYIVQKRSVRLTIIQLLAPFIACAILFWMDYISSNLSSESELDPQIKLVEKIPQCFYTDSDPHNCTTVLYSIIGDSEPWIHSVMKYVAKSNDLEMDKDVKYLSIANPSEYTENLLQNPNKTYIGVIFCNSVWQVSKDFSIPCNFETKTSKKLVFYNLIYNTSHALNSPLGGDFKSVFPKDHVATRLKVSIDNGILAYFSKDPKESAEQISSLRLEELDSPTIDVKIQDFPKLAFRFWKGSDLVSAMGAFMFFIPYIIHFIATVLEIVREKHKKLRQGLVVMGLSSNVYWISWFTTSLITNSVITFIVLLAGFLFGFKFFTDTPFLVLFSLFFSFGQSMQALAFWVTTICSTLTAGYTISYSFLLISVVLEYFFCNPYICYLVFMEDSPFWLVVLRNVLEFLPAYNYSIIFGGIAFKSGNHLQLDTLSWVPGPGFEYKDLFADQSLSMFGTNYLVPPLWRFYLNVLMNIILYSALALCLDNLLYQSNERLRSPFKKICRKSTSQKESSSPAESNLPNSLSESVKAEKEALLRNQKTQKHKSGLKVYGLDKIYQTGNFWSQENLVHAVKEIYFQVNNGELLGLLGHNGAGKTTLFGMLTGLFKPTSGTATIFGYDILTEMDKIQQIMGVCPQFDILWDELTPEEHLTIFAQLKHVPQERIDSEINKRLSQVNLLDVKKFPAGTFSGGMKRRLSMAIAFIGNPSIVFLDEPTTGMDPKNRRFIWELIQKMKKGRVVVLTTHAMEEADILSDRIAVVSKGSLKCIGTSLYLKNNYGDGYRLSLVVDKKELENVKSEIAKVIPSSRVLDSSGGSLLLGIPHSQIEELQCFLRIMEEEDQNLSAEEKGLKIKVKDWGLSHTTLEEVFMKIVKGSE